jgi:hypothetical protein
MPDGSCLPHDQRETDTEGADEQGGPGEDPRGVVDHRPGLL